VEDSDREGRLATDRNVWLCTVRGDGSPHVTPVWFTWVDDAFWMCTSSGSVKARNLRGDPRVSVTLEDGDRPIVAEGSARLHQRPYPERVADAFADKFGWDITVPGTDGDWAVLIQLPVRRWLLGGPARGST
jgi:PPOX class probable F420-dependent enzyme